MPSSSISSSSQTPAVPSLSGENIPRPGGPASVRGALLRLGSFFALVAVSAFGLQFAINTGLRHVKTAEFGVSNRIFTGTVNADIVISGSSRALDHYDPRIIERATGYTAFNIGRNGSQTDLQLAVLQAYLRHNRRPKLIIHNLDLFSFLSSHEIYDPAQYLPYLDEPSIYTAVRQVYPDAWKWKYLPLYGYAVEDMRFEWIQGLMTFAGLQPAEPLIQGYWPRHTPWTGDFEKFRESNRNGVRTEIEPNGIRDLTQLVETCKQDNIPLLFVYSPEYYEMQYLERNRAEIFARFREIAGRFGVQIWDFSDSPICMSRDNFYNSQHLNAEGASEFSSELARRLAASDLIQGFQSTRPVANAYYHVISK